MRAPTFAPLALGSAVLACGLGVVGVPSATDDGGAVGPDAGADSVAGDAAETGAPELDVWAHTESTLFRIAGATGASTEVARFHDGACEPDRPVGDIAIDRLGETYGSLMRRDGRSSELITIDKATGTCSRARGDMDRPCNGLTFAPDPAEPDREVLYATCDKELRTVNPRDGKTKALGEFGANLHSSGDVVYLPGHGLFATLTLADGSNDRLARLDPESGAATLVAADLTAKGLFGLAHHEGRILAFGDALARSIDPTTGASNPFSSTIPLVLGAAAGR